jgi:hypothetical protein
MAIEQRFTDLPTVTNSTLNDIICAVQGFVSSANPGLSTQQTLGQIQTLMQSNFVLFNSGNPNGAVAGNTFQLCWDTVDLLLWVCTTSGTASTAVWTKSIQITAGSGIAISQSGSNITISSSAFSNNFVVVSGTSQAMAVDTTYQANNAGLVTLTLPATAALGQEVAVTGFGVGGWTIAQNAGQNIQIGNSSSTVGVGSSVSSTNRFDGIALICTVANTTFQTISGGQGNLTIV